MKSSLNTTTYIGLSNIDKPLHSDKRSLPQTESRKMNASRQSAVRSMSQP